MSESLEQILAVDSEGSVTSPAGFMAGTSSCGYKFSNKHDLALLLSQRDCSAAGVFTQNQAAAAPVLLDRETLQVAHGRIRGVVANAGVANACTGSQGMESAKAMQRLASGAVGCLPDQMLVLSTGVIGKQLDMDRVATAIEEAASRFEPTSGAAVARAIMTTDRQPKHASVSLQLSGGKVILGGIAKGSGMIHPDMATMLAIVTTDAVVEPDFLQRCLFTASEQSFNRISVDGDTSTNDSVLLLANGLSGVPIRSKADRQLFGQGLNLLTRYLAKAIIRDGEGASKLVEINIKGAVDEASALQVARTIATSMLVKTAIAGGDPNWGRIIAAAGRSGVPLRQERISLCISAPGLDEIQLVAGGNPQVVDPAISHAIFSQSDISLYLDLGQGSGQTTYWTCDLTKEYVDINAHYHT